MLHMPVAFRLFAPLAAFLAVSAAPAPAGEVMLKSNAGGLTIAGHLLDFDGDEYVVENGALGAVRIKADSFRCLGADCPAGAILPRETGDTAPETVRVAGSDAIGARLMPQLIRDYASTLGAFIIPNNGGKDDGDAVLDLIRSGRTLVHFELKRHGSATAFAGLVSGTTDIGMASRAVSEGELMALSAAGLPDMSGPGHEYLIGLDGLAVILSPKNPVAALSIEEIAKIFSGEITDWSAFGGDPAPIKIYAGDERSGTFDSFNAVVLRPRNRQISPQAKRFRSEADLAREVASDAAGIGFVSFAQMPLAKPIDIKESCGLAHTPSEFGVKSQEYPLARKLFLYKGRGNNEYAAGLLDFAQSPAAAIRVEQLGFINRGVISSPYEDFYDLIAHALGAAPTDFDIGLMRQLQKDLGAGKRLSATIRFEKGSQSPDAESLEALARIPAFLEHEKRDGRKLILAGFSDASGAFGRNAELSYKRAAAIRDLLVPALSGLMKPEDIEVRGYGKLMPVACNDREAGREKNRRVEIWLVPVEQARPVVLIKQL
jgi:phosphate transport system substrate-binding protein